MDRNKVENILFKIGIPTNVKGFDYIADAMEVFEENGHRISITKCLYPEIAKRNDTTPSRVERAIRHALEIANSTRGDYENFEKYIGLTNTTNSAALISLYKHIKRESIEETKKESSDSEIKSLSPEMTAWIRKIVREELKRIVYGQVDHQGF